MTEANNSTKEILKNIKASTLINWFAAIGLAGDYDLEKGTTTWLFDDNSKITVSGSVVEVSQPVSE